MKEINLHLGYVPREQFVPFHERTQRFSCLVCHRRAGKTVASIADTIDFALQCELPRPRYAYIAPTFSQAKDVAWVYLKEMTRTIPGVEARESDLMVNLPNGAAIRLYGAENYDRMRGVYFDGATLDEPADIDPRAWSEVIRPALSDRHGWANFIGTPKGQNAFHKIWKQAQANEDGNWFSLMLKASETNILPEWELRSARSMLTQSQYMQEYECAFDAPVIGAYYAEELTKLEDTRQITSVPYDKAADCVTAWDLGINDPTIIWVAQMAGREIHLIDYYERADASLDDHVKWLKSKPYIYREHLLPHDVKAREMGSGKSRQEMLHDLGIDVRVLNYHKVQDGINAVKMALPRCWFDKSACERGLDALRMYRAERNEKREIFHEKPLHDWTSHAADAFRYLIMGMDERQYAAGRSRTWGEPDNSWVI